MANLQEVRDRLERAIGRLEAAQRDWRGRQEEKLAGMRVEAPHDRAGPDVDALVRGLEEAQAHNRSLVEERVALAAQVDAVIGSLRAVLDPGADRGPGGGAGDR